jgi:hypothetical protein
MLTAQTWPPDEVNGNLTLQARNKTDTSTSAFAHYGHYSRSLMLMYARLAAKACISLPILVRLIPRGKRGGKGGQPDPHDFPLSSRQINQQVQLTPFL